MLCFRCVVAIYNLLSISNFRDRRNLFLIGLYSSCRVQPYFFGCKVTLVGDHCIIRHSLRYYRHSGLVIYKSKLPAPSVSMPCDYRILQSPTKGQVKLVLLETVQRSLVGYWRNDIPLQKVRQKIFGGHVTYGVFCGGKTLKLRNQRSRSKAYISYFQNHSEVCTNFSRSLCRLHV